VFSLFALKQDPINLGALHSLKVFFLLLDILPALPSTVAFCGIKKYSSVQTATNRIEINTVGLIFCKDTHRKPSLNSGKLQIKKVRVRVSTFVSNNMGPAFVDGSDIRNKGNY